MKKLIKFSASWCQPCKSLAGNMKYVDFGDVVVEEIDIDENFDKAKSYGVRGVPTLVLEEDGKEVKRTSGVLMADQIEEFIK
jgi:thioredoxin 1